MSLISRMRHPFALSRASIGLALGLATISPSHAWAQEMPMIDNKCTLSPTTVFEHAAPGILHVISRGVDPFRVHERVRMASGSGFMIEGGIVVTNYHVVADAETVVVTENGVVLPVEVIGVDPLLDLALLKADYLPMFFKPLELAPTNEITVGQTVYAIGYPLGIGKSISSGIVSGVGRVLPLNTSSWLSPFIQTDASTSAGNSGGPLLDACGRVIGVVTLHLEAPEAENIGFAIPVSTLHAVLPELKATGKIARPWHGLYGQMVSPEILHMVGLPSELWTEGFLVETVEPGSASDRAGLQGGNFPIYIGVQEIILGGDIITHVDDRKLITMEDALNVVLGLEIGQTVRLRILRQAEEMELTVVIDERPILERDLERYRGPRAQ